MRRSIENKKYKVYPTPLMRKEGVGRHLLGDRLNVARPAGSASPARRSDWNLRQAFSWTTARQGCGTAIRVRAEVGDKGGAAQRPAVMRRFSQSRHVIRL